MMNRIKSFLNRNASTILSVVASLGVFGTGFLSAKATYDYLKAAEKKRPKNKKEKAILIAKNYILPTTVALSTSACIFSANMINRNRIIGLTGACSLLNDQFIKYRDKLKELHGKEADIEVASAIALEKFPEGEITEGKQLFYDRASNRFFESTMRDVFIALYNLNKLFQFEGEVSINDFYRFLELETIGQEGDFLGWWSWEMAEDGLIPWLNAEPVPCYTCDGREYFLLEFEFGPVNLTESHCECF